LNACAIEISDQVTEEAGEYTRPIPGRDLSWMDSAFAAWGKWIWERRDFEGHATADPIHAYIHGAGGGMQGHRVLCKDMPPWIRLAHSIWLMLPEHEGVAIYAEYVPGVGDDGRLWSRAEKCLVLKITEEGFRKRLQRARGRIFEWSKRRRS
jgi:hypothetical protein